MLYNLFSVISRKTVRKNERFYLRYKKHNKYMFSTLVRTNRGYFIDGCNVDLASVKKWHALNNDAELAKRYYDIRQEELKKLEESKNEEA